jgi:hypothetical protein
MRAEHGLDCAGLLLVESGPACHSPCRAMAAVSEGAIKEEHSKQLNLTADGSAVVPCALRYSTSSPVPVHAARQPHGAPFSMSALSGENKGKRHGRLEAGRLA